MPQSRVFGFRDPESYQAAVRAGAPEVFVTDKGEFRAELTQIDFDRLWLQRGSDNLSRVIHVSIDPERAPIQFLADVRQPAMQHDGVDVSSGEIVVYSAGATFHQRTMGPCRWAAMSLTPEELAAAAETIIGRELAVPSHSHIIRPAPALMARLMALHEAATALAKAAPGALANPSIVKALEQELVHAMVACLGESLPSGAKSCDRQHTRVISRFEDFLAARRYEPVYLAEICAAIGVSERTLRTCCQEHLGMSPIHYLWLRRMHLAHRALLRADSTTATVTAIATDHGFWELGRFSVQYRRLFGETPSVSLHRPPQEAPARRLRH
jgi:AraC-like DNA-binding protein